MKEIEIEGKIYKAKDVDQFSDKFIDFIEENNWYFGGGYTDEKTHLTILGCAYSKTITKKEFQEKFKEFLKKENIEFKGKIKTISYK